MERLEKDLLELLYTDSNQGILQLQSRYYNLVKTIAYGKLGTVCSKEDIEEVINDIFYECYSNREKIDLQKGSLKAFVCVLARNKAVTLFHKEIKYKQRHIMTEEETLHKAAEEQGEKTKDSIEQQMIRKEEKEQLLCAMEKLDFIEREIIARKQYLGQTFRMIAKDMELKQKTVEKKYERALKKLRKQLGGVLDA